MKVGLLPRDVGLGWSEWGILLSLLEERKRMKRMHALCHPGHSKDTKSPEIKKVAAGKKKHWHKAKNNRSTKRESLSSRELYTSILYILFNPNKVTLYIKINSRWLRTKKLTRE